MFEYGQTRILGFEVSLEGLDIDREAFWLFNRLLIGRGSKPRWLINCC